MSDERIVEVIAEKLLELNQQTTTEKAAPEILAALRGAGFDVYRPEDEEAGHWWITTGVETDNGRKVVGPFDTKDDCFVARTYIEKAEGHHTYWIERLVPVGGDS